MQIPIFTIDIHLIWFPMMFLGQFVANKINVLTSQSEEITPFKSPKNNVNEKPEIEIINPSDHSNLKENL
jgi:hypothetical protein